MGEISSNLYAEPSFLEGMARVLDIGNTLNEYNRSEFPDCYAILGDWRAVGFDIQHAMQDYYEQFLALKLAESRRAEAK